MLEQIEIRGKMSATKKNVAKSVAEFLFKKTEEFKKGESEKCYEKIMRGINGDKEVLTNLEIKAGKIRLPELMTKMSGLEDGEEVVLVAENGKVEIRKHDIK